MAEESHLSGRLRRYTNVSIALAKISTKFAGARYLGLDTMPSAHDLKEVLGELKGPLLKIFQLLAAIPDALPAEVAQELSQLQSQAPAMGKLFVRRRMKMELGEKWQENFQEFNEQAVAAASLGQVHKATLKSGEVVACKLQYPDMSSTVEADIKQLKAFLKIFNSGRKALKTEDAIEEIEARLKEELDYTQEAEHIKIYQKIFENNSQIEVPKVIQSLTTKRLLTLSWVEGAPLKEQVEKPLEARESLAKTLFYSWYYPFYHYGVIHGDPHFGNYLFTQDQKIHLLDFGCVRIFDPSFVGGVIELYKGLLKQDQEQIVEAYKVLGFKDLSKELIEILNLWAKYLYGPLLEDRVRPIDERYSSLEGQEIAGKVYEKLQRAGGVAPPKQFIFLDRATVGLGAAFMHLKVSLNWHQLFNDLIQDFSISDTKKRQKQIII